MSPSLQSIVTFVNAFADTFLRFTSVFTAEYDDDDGSSILDDIPEVGMCIW